MPKKVKEAPDSYEIQYKTKSGFSLEITPLPPYYLDIVEDLHPLLDYPAREINLLAGDVVEEPYDPPEEKPDSDHDDYGLWLRWHEVDKHNKAVEKKRIRAKRDLLMSVCIKILDGPIDVDDESWMIDLEAPFIDIEFKVPKHVGERKLMFLKYHVIRSIEEAQEITQITMFKEVSMEGVSRALKGFQGNLGRDTTGAGNSGKQGDSPS